MRAIPLIMPSEWWRAAQVGVDQQSWQVDERSVVPTGLRMREFSPRAKLEESIFYFGRTNFQFAQRCSARFLNNDERALAKRGFAFDGKERWR